MKVHNIDNCNVNCSAFGAGEFKEISTNIKNTLTIYYW